MPLAHLNGKLIFFAHVPKTGGTSIVSFLRKNGRVALVPPGFHGWSKCTIDHAEKKVYRFFIPDDFYDHGFVVFRDPVSRMQSEVRMAAQTCERSWNPVNVITGLWAKRRGVDLYAFRWRGLSWHMTVDRWARIALWLAKRNPYQSNNHFRPQSEFYHPGLRVFFYEDGLDPVAAWLVETCDLETGASLDHIMPKGNSGVVKDIDFLPETEALIRSTYAADYALFDDLRPETASSSG